MKTRFKLFVLSFLCLGCQFEAFSQDVCDKELVGVWIYTKYQVRDKFFSNDFSSIKIYGSDGEYCCAQVQRLKSGAYKIIPYDYGTYIYRNGEYTECGRKGNLNLVSPTEFNGQWIGRIEHWEKVEGFPSELKSYIIKECRKIVLGDDEVYQQMIDKYWINYRKQK